MKIALLGDIALIGRYDKTQSADVEKRIEVVHNLVSDCDCVIANLESPLTSRIQTMACKGVYLRSDPLNVQLLKYMGVTHVTLANNHLFDYGKTGAIETIRTLEESGIKYVGLNNQPEIVKCGDSIVTIDGFCCLSANALNYGSKNGQVKMLSYEGMEAFLKYSEAEKCVPIASVHFGLEGLHYPSQEHMNLFRKLAEEHLYILHGNHPHAIQGYETCNGSLLIYAQGNLCFDITPVTSIHLVPNEKPEERKCFVSIIELENNTIVKHTTIGLTDLETDALHVDPKVDAQLVTYTEALKRPILEVQSLRAVELAAQRSTSEKRDLHFILNRLNYKYIGAYLNGRKHAKSYNKLFAGFKGN